MLCCHVLQVLHKGRTQAPVARKPESQKVLKQLQDAHEIYLAPFGSNDDWYWIYAAVKAGGWMVEASELVLQHAAANGLA